VDVQTLKTQTFIVRPVGGEPLPGRYSSQFNIVNFAPSAPLLANTTYEVVIPAGGIKDYAGNPTGETFTSRFSTGISISLARAPAKASRAMRFRAMPEGIAFVIPGDGRRGQANLSLRDSKGSLLRELSFESDGGDGSVQWDGRTSLGESAGRGLVVATLKKGSQVQSLNVFLP
jgi:hypothetical protein